jgi:arsenite methyltransferase
VIASVAFAAWALAVFGHASDLAGGSPSPMSSPNHAAPATADAESWADCGTGALEHDRYLSVLAEVVFRDTSIEYTHQTSPGFHGAIIRGVRP